jgi:hypothetical protein
MARKKKYMTATEITEQNSELLASTPLPMNEPEEVKPIKKAKAEVCRACQVCDRTESYEHNGKKFVKCKGCGFLVAA